MFSPRVLLSFCVIFCQFQPGVAYESVAYKKAFNSRYLRVLTVCSSEAVVLRCSVKKVFLKMSQISQKNTCVGVSFLIKLFASSLTPVTLLKRRLSHRCLPVNFAKLLRTPFLQNISGCCF